MFSKADVRRILGTLGSGQVLGPDQATYVTSRTGDTVVAKSAVQRRLADYISANGSVQINELPQLLDVENTEAAVKWADGQPGFATPNNGRLSISPWIQKTIAVRYYHRTRTVFTKLEDESAFWGLPEDTITRIVKVYERSFFSLDEVEGYHCSSSLRRRTEKHIKKQIDGSDQAAMEVKLSRGAAGAPVEVILCLARTLLKDRAQGDHELQTRPDGVHYVPIAALRAQSVQDIDTLVEQHRCTLTDQGVAIVTTPLPQQATILEKLAVSTTPPAPPSSANHTVAQTKVAGPFQILHRHPATPPSSWPAPPAVVVVRSNELVLAVDMLHTGLRTVAKAIWAKTQDGDTNFSTTAIAILQNGYRDDELFALYLHCMLRDELATAYGETMQRLAEEAHREFVDVVGKKVFAPVGLYVAGWEIAGREDEVLRERVGEFVLQYLREEVLPAAGKSVEGLDLKPSKADGREWERFVRDVAPCRTIEQVRKCVDRLGRKVKVDGSEMMGDTKLEMLEQKLKVLKRAKRGSDVLQQATWVLLASIHNTPALFLSSGKDATRMVRLYAKLAQERLGAESDGIDANGQGGKVVDWADAATRLEEYRNKVKEGKQTDSETEAINALAAAAFDARKLHTTTS